MYWGKDDPPMYYPDGRPANDAARDEGPPSWADRRVKEDHEALEYAKELLRREQLTQKRYERDD